MAEIASALQNFILFFGIYALIVSTITLVALFTKGWTKVSIFILVLLWIPVIVGTILLLFIIQPEILSKKFFLSLLVIGGPLIAIIIISFIVFKLIDFFWRL